jgi:uncharacterized protein (TIGR02246 family)
MRFAGAVAKGMVLVLGLLAVGFGGPVQAGADSEADKVRAVVETYQRALNGGDVDAVMKVYAADGVFMPEHSPASVGPQALRRAYEKVFQAIDLDVRFHIVEVEILSRDWALARTTSDGTIEINATGAQLANNSQELFILQKQASNEWKFARYAFSSTKPPQ